MPCVIGRENSVTVKMHLLKQSLTSAASKLSLHLPLNKDNLPPKVYLAVKQNHVSHKLVLTAQKGCKSISKEHLILRYDFEDEQFQLLALCPLSLNNTTIDITSGFVPIKALDQVHFFCDDCYLPHLFYVVFPSSVNDESNY